MIFSRLSIKIVKKSFNKLTGMSSLIAKIVDLSKLPSFGGHIVLI